MQTYTLMLRLTIEAADDAAAREVARNMEAQSEMEVVNLTKEVEDGHGLTDTETLFQLGEGFMSEEGYL